MMSKSRQDGNVKKHDSFLETIRKEQKTKPTKKKKKRGKKKNNAVQQTSSLSSSHAKF